MTPMPWQLKKTIKGDIKTVWHAPKEVSPICLIFIRHGGSIMCLVNCSRIYLSDCGHEMLEFVASNLNEARKTM